MWVFGRFPKFENTICIQFFGGNDRGTFTTMSNEPLGKEDVAMQNAQTSITSNSGSESYLRQSLRHPLLSPSPALSLSKCKGDVQFK